MIENLDNYNICPNCKSPMITIREGKRLLSSNNFVLERELKCVKCGTKIRQSIYLNA